MDVHLMTFSEKRDKENLDDFPILPQLILFTVKVYTH